MLAHLALDDGGPACIWVPRLPQEGNAGRKRAIKKGVKITGRVFCRTISITLTILHSHTAAPSVQAGSHTEREPCEMAVSRSLLHQLSILQSSKGPK